VQTAIMLFLLIMAALMIPGGKAVIAIGGLVVSLLLPARAGEQRGGAAT
jgi:hypothetical protein